MKKRVGFIVALCAAVWLTGCGGGGEQAKELNIYTWADYVPGEVVARFEEETGIKVNYDNFSENEEMYAKLQATKGGQYDIIICSDYIVDVMRKEGGLIQELDTAKLSNYGNVDPNFQNKYYDPDNKYTVPYAAGCAMLMYDTARVPFEIKSYQDLWNPALRDSVVVLDDQRGMIGMALMLRGGSVNETDPEKLEAAKNDLLELKPNIIGFDADKPHDYIISGAAKAGYMFGSQVTAAMEALPSVTFAYPEEGMTFNIDNFVVAKNAPNLENAYTFINYMLDGETSAKASSIINYINCNTAAQPFLPEEFINNKTVNIPQEELAKAQIYEDMGETAVLYTRIWTEVKSQ